MQWPERCRLNLIEPWWKQLKALALKGRGFETTAELEASLLAALDYWNRHRRPYRWWEIPDVMPKTILGGYGSILLPHTA